MVKIDLITGFLGSGKTTFIKKYARYLHGIGEKVGILENDYGAINVDMLLLNELKQDGIGLEMVAGGCDYDCHRRRFKTKLITLAMLGYDRVIVEPSGIFDVDEFYDMLQEDELYDRYTIENVLTIVNADLEDELSAEAEYILASQAATSGKIIFSFVKDTDPEHIKKTIVHIQNALQAIGCKRHLDDAHFLAKDWDDLTEDDLAMIMHAGYQETGYVKKYALDDTGFDSLFFMNPEGTEEEILDEIDRLWKDQTVGKIFRIKGFVRNDSHWREINSTPVHTEVRDIEIGQEVLIVIGENLNTPVIETYFKAAFSTLHTQ